MKFSVNIRRRWFFLLLSVGIMPSLTPDLRAQQIVGYVDTTDTTSILDAVGAGYSALDLGFIDSDASGNFTYDATKAWENPANLNDVDAAALTTVQQSGVNVMLSFGGAGMSSADYSYWASSASQTAILAADLASYVESATLGNGGTFHFNGIDLDYEDTAALTGTTAGYNGVTFIENLTTDLRNDLGSSSLISEAPQSAYLLSSFVGSGSAYQAIMTAVGSKINFLNVQFYNTPSADGNGTVTGVEQTYEQLITDMIAAYAASGTTVTAQQLIGQYLLGLPMASGQAGDNLFTGAQLQQIIEGLDSNYGTDIGGVMGWQLWDSGTNVATAFASNAQQALSVSPAPEPSSIGLFLAALAVLAFATRLTRKTKA